MRRRKLLVALAGLAVVGAAGAVVLWRRSAHVTRASCDRIRVGMSRAEVEAILGGPPGDYRAGPTVGPEFEESFRTVVHLPELSHNGSTWPWIGDGPGPELRPSRPPHTNCADDQEPEGKHSHTRDRLQKQSRQQQPLPTQYREK
jgi:hypothetical protein